MFVANLNIGVRESVQKVRRRRGERVAFERSKIENSPQVRTCSCRHINICIDKCVYVYIYICRERERERERGLCIYMYMCICILYKTHPHGPSLSKMVDLTYAGEAGGSRSSEAGTGEGLDGSRNDM